MLRRLLQALFSGAFALTLAGLIGAASAFLFWLIVAHSGSQSTLGRAATVVLAGSLINAVTSFGLTVGLLRVKAQDLASRQMVLWAAVLSLSGSGVLAVMVGSAWSSSWLRAAHVTRDSLVTLLFELAVGLALSTLLDTVAVGYGAPNLAVGRNVVVFVARLAITVIVPSSLHHVGSVTQAFTAPLVLSVVPALPLFLWRTRQTLPWRGVPGLARHVLSISFQSWPSSLVFNAVTLGVPLTVSLSAGPLSGAVFYLLWNVGTLANSIIAALTSLGLGDDKKYRQRDILWRTGLVALGGAVGGEVALVAFGASYFRQGWIAGLLLGAALLPYGQLQFRVMRLRRAAHHHHASLATLVLLVASEIPLLMWHTTNLVFAASIWLAATTVAVLTSA